MWVHGQWADIYNMTWSEQEDGNQGKVQREGNHEMESGFYHCCGYVNTASLGHKQTVHLDKILQSHI